MIRDRYLLWLIITALTVLMLVQFIGQGMINHWQAQDAKLSLPNPVYYRLGGR